MTREGGMWLWCVYLEVEGLDLLVVMIGGQCYYYCSV